MHPYATKLDRMLEDAGIHANVGVHLTLRLKGEKGREGMPMPALWFTPGMPVKTFDPHRRFATGCEPGRRL